MHRIPGGTLLLPKSFGTEAGETIQLEAFRMNEALVTNQQYVNFLNAVLPRITVQDSVVEGNGQIWLMLGEVVKGYEPIVFRNGRFYVKNSLHTACPVVRVTAYGAQAYVDHYGFRLPSKGEWLWVAQRQARRLRPVSQSNDWRSAESWMMKEMADSTSTTRTAGKKLLSGGKDLATGRHIPVKALTGDGVGSGVAVWGKGFVRGGHRLQADFRGMVTGRHRRFPRP
ncbi:Sulfatase-modifying factor enzyme 1 [Desulfacinum hydrothermale DSM 13146]|uniref:Sulfatase-modifying factor enzyme 1 n=1 Tax=Desulfacinum hydrothermale DSM 13146 TaxID=1121390 RepID=A0A1W1XEW0_9BACT|nr:SUMF1/EgtB/PvdO family nonheme iron enzyme [Desulfacinum hydrothermale]SMC22342.1 Sulfatase-modifying factor enzyme 1 [Desulfacinum hydrothermale DSM 13146]